MNKSIEQEIVKALYKVLEKKDYQLHEPQLEGNEIKYLKQCINSGYVSSVGNFVNKFASLISKITKASFVIPVSSGTAGLHIALKLVGVEENDEVLLPSLTFVATANAISYCGAITNFVDVQEETLGLDPMALRKYLKNISKFSSGLTINKKTGRKIKCILPMHTFGHPCDMEEIQKVANEFNLPVIEDAAESLGSYYKNTHTGTIGEIGVLSFNGNKIATTGGGGAILTNDKNLAEIANHITTTAKIKHKWAFIHDQIGYNYRMPNINAALGCAQLEKLPQFLISKRKLYLKYLRAFQDIENVELFCEPRDTLSNYWLQTILLNRTVSHKRELILNHTNYLGIGTRPAWNLLHTLKPFQKSPRDELKTSLSLFERIINLPSSSSIIK